MNKPLRTLFLCALPAVALLASAQSAPTSPRAGSAERTAIMNALRVPVQKELKQKIKFKVERLKVQRGWAFLYGQPIQLNGKPVDYRRSKYQEAIKAGMFDDNFAALLRKQGGKWRVVTHRIGMTDVAWIDWDKRYGAPSAILK